MYQPTASWGKKLNYTLAFLRGISVALVVFLLLSPLVHRTETIVDKAKIVFAIDNSESVRRYGPKAIGQISAAIGQLSDAGFEVDFQVLNKDQKVSAIDSVRFDQKKTDLSALLKMVKSNYEGSNLTDVILLSDGIVTQGTSPAFGQYPFRISSIAVGDTVPVADISIKDVIHNKVAYLGNEFPLRAEIVAHGLSGKTTHVTLRQGGKVIATEKVIIDQKDFYKTYEFKTSSAEKGLQHYTVELGNVAGEKVVRNNKKEIYIDIIDGRQRILLMAMAPHPDIKAFRNLIEANDNYELEVQTLSISNSPPVSSKPYDLVILHQIPNVLGLGNASVRKFVDAKVPLFFVLGNQSAIPLVNSFSRALAINVTGTQTDRVSARFNTSFQQLNFDAESLKLLERLPPLSVPFGEYNVLSGSETILFQKVGTLPTRKPLLLLNTAAEPKTAILAGEGIWQWRQEEFALTDKQDVVDNLFQKVIQILAVKEDKRKFRVYPVKGEFETGEQVVFQTEIYNDIYEELYGQEVKLVITNEKGAARQFSYVHSRENARFNISGLPEGAYRFQASTVLKGKDEQVRGQFVISELDQEMANTTADFNMLRELSAHTGGEFLKAEALPGFIDKLKTNRPADRLDALENTVELIHLKWLFFVILLLLALEWGTRKYLGGY
ncbi:vWA domain-containing protein [Dyadobacter helix]|uniref:VWA domain-containing protein n=1 Tax=Dyadobacter helix TaxID=2822344 RepID=UPI001E4BD906|nr:VWA domain-containing protein [Dyadobacter sp. CECT 9275]